jgi:hypothetical protein
MAASPRFFDLLGFLARQEVEFILVGGVAAILEGAPVSTFDLDIMIRPTAENGERLLSALRGLNARYLDPAGRHIVPDAEKLANMRLHRLLTDQGPLNVLERIGSGLTYSDLIDHTRVYEVAGLQVRVLKLEMIILSKEQANRDKDKATLPVLRRALQLQSSEDLES